MCDVWCLMHRYFAAIDYHRDASFSWATEEVCGHQQRRSVEPLLPCVVHVFRFLMLCVVGSGCVAGG